MPKSFINQVHIEISADSKMKAPPEEIRYESCESEKLKQSDKKTFLSQVPPKMSHVLSKNSSTYELEKFEKKALLIFDNMHIKDHSPRFGTEKDVEQLIATFSQFDFQVNLHRDLTKAEIMKALQHYSAQDWSEYGCIVVAVLTHGSEDGLLTADGQHIRENDLISHFSGRKPTLATKPKVFIIQACRGIQKSVGVEVSNKERTSSVSKDTEVKQKFSTMPIEPDMIILHSSYKGHLSFRNPHSGSWFIQSLCNNINKYAKSHDLERILIFVRRNVAIECSHTEYDRGKSAMQILKQMPVVTSTLIRQLFLRKYSMDKPTTNGNLLQEENKITSTENKPAPKENKTTSTENKTESSEIIMNTP